MNGRGIQEQFVVNGPGEQISATLVEILRERRRGVELIELLKPSTKWTVAAAIARGTSPEAAADRIRAQRMDRRLRRAGGI